VFGTASNSYPNGQWRGARLLQSGTGPKSRVNDAIYFLSNQAASNTNLGLCTNNAYNGSFIAVQQRNGPFRSGNSGSWFVTCGATDSYAGGTANTNAGGEWTARAGLTANVAGAYPANADDCGRLCGWMYRDNGDSSTLWPNTCGSWEWVVNPGGAAANNGNNGVCNLYSDRSVTNGQLSLVAGRTNVVAAGGRAGGIFQTTGVTSWKRSLDGAAGRYKRDLWVEERSEDWLKPDLILKSSDF
jgi:hypothetical protein